MLRKLTVINGEVLIFISSILAVSLSIFPIATGYAFTIIDSNLMAITLAILVSIETMAAGIIFSHSFAQFIIHRRFRDLVLIVMSINLIITGLFYIMTNGSMIGISPFADVVRNRTIVVAFALVLAPASLFGTITDRKSASKKRIYMTVLWGLIISPFLSIWFLLSPEPVFVVTDAGSGFLGINLATLLVLLFIIPTMLIALTKFVSAWKREGVRMDFALANAIVIWLIVISIFVVQSDPFQFIELIWFSLFIFGAMTIALVVISSEVIEPQKALTSLVIARTRELEESKTESEFYLNIWGHKIGNLLQTMTLYFEMFASGMKKPEELSNLAESAIDIGNETNMINRQVSTLLRLKEQEDTKLEECDLLHHLDSFLKMLDVSQNDIIFSDNNNPSYVCILADSFLDTLLFNLYTFISKHGKDYRITISAPSEACFLEIQYKGARLPIDLIESLFNKLVPSRTSMNLDLFIVKILMNRYQGKLEYEYFEETEDNQLCLIFKSPSKDEKDISPQKFLEVT
ncbi:hypothetical protein EU527_11285 [Candidatus Thorarchaeota archaeon]|nr:MAG: hypothetical protein EU527_11285 [Candidatus Thorarchaeota archaeon]